MSKVRFDIHHVKLWTNFTTQSEETNSPHTIYDLNIYFDVDADIAIAGSVFLHLFIFN